MRMTPRLFVLLALAVVLAACARPPRLAEPEGVRLTPLRTISRPEAQILLRVSGVKGLRVDHPVDCYRMEYDAPRADGTARRLSGLLALPRGARARRLVSFQHGTVTTPSAVPSKPDGTGLAVAIAFAGAGHALVAPDYPGLGRSTGRHPYYVADEEAAAVVGMIDAARRVAGVPAGPPFLAGFSQGSHASLAAVRRLEGEGRPALGSAQVAGAYDLRNVSLPAAMRGGADAHSLYLAYLAWAYADHYRQPLASVLTPEHAALAERLFGEPTKPKAIQAALPKAPREMFAPAFLEAFDHGRPHWFLEAVAANGLADLTPRTPLRLYYGSQDRDVAPAESIGAAQAMRSRGDDVQAVDLGAIDHEASALAAAPRILQWLSTLDGAG